MKQTLWAVVAATALGLTARRAEAGAVIDISQVGSNVVVTGTGTITLTGLTNTMILGDTFPAIDPGYADVDTARGTIQDFRGSMGPTSFGPGAASFASSSSGDPFGISVATEIEVPYGYVSGTPLSGTATYANQTFSSLGLTPGTYTYTWSSDSITVIIGAAVPEPSSFIEAALGILTISLFVGVRRFCAR
jgi:hypothetical protein